MDYFLQTAKLKTITSVPYQNLLEVDYNIRYMETKLGINNPEELTLKLNDSNKPNKLHITRQRTNIEKPHESDRRTQMRKSIDIFRKSISNASNKKDPFQSKNHHEYELSKSINGFPEDVHVDLVDKEVSPELDKDIMANRLNLNYQQVSLKPIGCKYLDNYSKTWFRR